MGTNYYWVTTVKETCEHCGSEKECEEKLHIGKSSVGWIFNLRIHSGKGIVTLKDWIRVWISEKGQIVNEHGVEVSLYKMLNIIMNCKVSMEQMNEQLINQSGEKDGTWSCINYEFC